VAADQTHDRAPRGCPLRHQLLPPGIVQLSPERLLLLRCGGRLCRHFGNKPESSEPFGVVLPALHRPAIKLGCRHSLIPLVGAPGAPCVADQPVAAAGWVSCSLWPAVIGAGVKNALRDTPLRAPDVSLAPCRVSPAPRSHRQPRCTVPACIGWTPENTRRSRADGAPGGRSTRLCSPHAAAAHIDGYFACHQCAAGCRTAPSPQTPGC